VFEIARQADPSAGKLLLTGFDFSREMLQEARRKLSASPEGSKRAEIQFMEGDARDMPFEEGHFDSMGITFGLRNLVYENSSASRHLEEMNRILKKGGELVVLESSKPSKGLWRFFNDLYLRFVLPYLGGLISGNLKAYQYLARSSRNYFTREEMGGILEEAGFRVKRSRSLFMGSVMLLVLDKP
jgi:demethylmenaquinone methyltransferase/2-methoxy-6-polyprenyl-1,4-benzoquinol methylase